MKQLVLYGILFFVVASLLRLVGEPDNITGLFTVDLLALFLIGMLASMLNPTWLDPADQPKPLFSRSSAGEVDWLVYRGMDENLAVNYYFSNGEDDREDL